MTSAQVLSVNSLTVQRSQAEPLRKPVQSSLTLFTFCESLLFLLLPLPVHAVLIAIAASQRKLSQSQWFKFATVEHAA